MADMITFTESGDLTRTFNFLKKIKKIKIENILHQYGRKGVIALMAATPYATGETAASWYYSIEVEENTSYLYFNNSHIEDGVKIAVILQYGHATRNGGYIEGIDYINPALRSIIQELTDAVWEEVARA